ncbi:methyltransferase RsmF C-terminal domain-like protein [Anditalea andensis]|uniref:methyltransferase RsmF C-terminal domain-like protein n=1 Tax=Anditalea andensis TaxID=1048983 RepID=UPI000555288E|nr:tRNA/rRNA cytosine-C5-methylase [Anditalea andensis]
MSPTPDIPQNFALNVQDLLGIEESEKLIAALDENPATSIRINKFKINENPFGGNEIPWSRDGYYLLNRPSFTLDPIFHGGAYYVQESSSVFIEYVLNILQAPKGLYLDLCAAPGGKSTILSSYLGSEGMLISNEVIKARSSILKENIIKWGLGNVIVTNNDPANFENLEGAFDLVLIDAPCSGEGMFRKDPSAREEWSMDHVQICAARQERILNSSGALVKAGGYLLYSTCTFNRHENEDNLKFLLEEFSYEPVRIPIHDEWGIVEHMEEIDGIEFYSYRFYPHRVEGEGFFITVLKRPDNAYIQTPRKAKDFRHPYIQRVSDDFIIKSASDLHDGWVFYALQDSYFVLNIKSQQFFEWVVPYLNIRYFGVELGKLNKSQLIPTHAYALSILPKDNYTFISLSKENALSYLRKDELHIELELEGWGIVTYKGIPLGWIKNIGNRINNYYPKEWRIRMKI